MDKQIFDYAPILIFIVCFLFKNKIFATPEQLLDIKTKMVEYVAEHYVPIELYRDNHKRLEAQIDIIGQRIEKVDTNVDELKNMFITKLKN